MDDSLQAVSFWDATAQPRNRVERRDCFSLRLTPFPARSNLPATRSDHLPVWLMPPAARSVPPAGRLTDLSTRLAQSTARLTLPTIRLVSSTLWLDELSVRLAFPAARLDGPAAPINQLSAPVNRPAVRFLAKNTSKPPKTASFAPPATPVGQKAAVQAGATARRASVLDCGSPLPLWRSRHARKRQRAAAVQNLAGKPISTLNPQPSTSK